jgi:hypothetical protein
MAHTPIEIRRQATSGLFIRWSDGETSTITSEALRRGCPCAGCKEKRGDTSHSKPLSRRPKSLSIIESSLVEELDLQEIWVVGQYALGMRWGDGHNSGIYPFSYLFELGAGTVAD